MNFWEYGKKIGEILHKIKTIEGDISRNGINLDNIAQFIDDRLEKMIDRKISEKLRERDLHKNTFPSENPEDFRPNHMHDRKVKRKYADLITNHYENKCACCGYKKKLTLDHYFIPRSQGGSLIMKHSSGLYHSNVVLLCEKCNSDKGSMKPEVFIKDSETLDYIAEKNSELTEILRKEIEK